MASAAHAFEAELKGRFGFTETGGVLVLGQTNLPDGLRLVVTVTGGNFRGKQIIFRGKQIIAVEEGRFRAGPYQIQETGLPSGAYRLVIDAGTAASQPAAVREAIGENWSAVASPLIVADAEGRRRLVREVDFTID